MKIIQVLESTLIGPAHMEEKPVRTYSFMLPGQTVAEGDVSHLVQGPLRGQVSASQKVIKAQLREGYELGALPPGFAVGVFQTSDGSLAAADVDQALALGILKLL